MCIVLTLHICSVVMGGGDFNTNHFPNGCTHVIHNVPQSNISIRFIPYQDNHPLFNINYRNTTSKIPSPEIKTD